MNEWACDGGLKRQQLTMALMLVLVLALVHRLLHLRCHRLLYLRCL